VAPVSVPLPELSAPVPVEPDELVASPVVAALVLVFVGDVVVSADAASPSSPPHANPIANAHTARRLVITYILAAPS